MARGERIEKVGREHLGRLIVDAGGAPYCPKAIFGTDFKCAIDDNLWDREIKNLGGYYYWVPDEPKEERKTPSEQLDYYGYGSPAWGEEVENILDDLDARLRALEERGE